MRIEHVTRDNIDGIGAQRAMRDALESDTLTREDATRLLGEALHALVRHQITLAAVRGFVLELEAIV